MELDEFGTLTLLAVSPWKVSGELTGYIELGKDIRHITPELSRILGVELFLAIDKRFVDRTAWEQTPAVREQSADWDRLSGFIIASRTIGQIPENLGHYLNRPPEQRKQLKFRIPAGDKDYRCGLIALMDAGNRQIGEIVVLNNVAAEQASLATLSTLLIVCCATVAVLLFLPFYSYLGRIERRLIHTHNEMEDEIDRRCEAETALRTSQEKWRSLAENVPDSIVTVDKDCRILFVNHTDPDSDRARIIGADINDYILPEYDGRVKQSLRQVFETAQPTSYEVRSPAPGGGAQWHLIRIGPVLHDGGVSGATLINTDITKRKRLEKDILEISDREHRQIGQDLHDGLIQHLSGIAFLSDILTRELKSESLPQSAQADEINTLMRAAIEQARNLTRILYPVELHQQGLVVALEILARNITKIFRMTCRFNCENHIPHQDVESATHVYRIAQEAVSNAIKHSRCDEVTINIAEHDGKTAVSVIDDGVGISQRDIEAPVSETGMGLQIMKYRASMINADLSILRREEGGTIVTCTFTSSNPRQEQVVGQEMGGNYGNDNQ